MTQRKPLPDILTATAASAPAPVYDLVESMVGARTGLSPAVVEHAKLMLAEATRIDVVKDIRDKAEALRQYAKQAGDSLEAQNLAAEIKLRAERRAGELVSELEREQGKRTDLQLHSTMERSYREVLAETHIAPTTAHRWQKIAEVPEDTFEGHIRKLRDEAGELTTASVLRLAPHKPRPTVVTGRTTAARCRKCGRTLTDPDAIRAGVGACCAARLVQGAAAGEAKAEAADAVDSVDAVDALPEWVTAFDERSAEPSAPTDSAPAPTVAPPLHDSGAQGQSGTDGKLDVLARLAQRLSDLVGVMRELGQSYGEVTGDFTTPLEVKHRLEKMQVRVQANMPNGGWE